MPRIGLWFQRLVGQSFTVWQGANKAAAGLNAAGRAIFREATPCRATLNLPQRATFRPYRRYKFPPRRSVAVELQGIQMMKMKVKTAALPPGLPVKLYLAAAAIVLALLAIPHIGHAQGIVRGAQEGSHEGNRVAGPIGGVVGGAVGAGVGGAMGAVKGVFGITDRGYRCRGYYDRHDRFHCYR
jgi:hypothetical protein